MNYFSGKSSIGRLLAIFAILAASGGSASANPVAFSNVNFENGQGTLSGFFQTNGSAAVSSWDLQTSTFNYNPGNYSVGYPGIHYTESTSSASISYSSGNQAITFHDNNSTFVLAFVLDCGGNGADCIANATLGSTINLVGAFEMDGIDFQPYRALTLASLDVTDPPIGLSFNVVPRANSVPEPQTMLLFAPALAALVGLRRRGVAQRGK